MIALAITTSGLIAIIQWLCFVSRRDQGILFDEDINSLSLRRSFCYLYLPTIISVLYSFLWTWIDLDVKRLEPFFQLSKDGGAKGGASILLSYPLEFLAAIPWKAFKSKHWSVLSASSIMIMIFWGLTPTQAGIFAVRTVAVEGPAFGSYSIIYTPLGEQGNLSSTYAQSVYNIAWLNETLPPFMTKDYVLSPFAPFAELPGYASNANYTGNTTLYSIDVSCEDAMPWNKTGIWYYNTTTASPGCSFYAPPYRPSGGNDTSKPYDAMYAGYQNENGFADYYMSTYCDESYFHSFFIRWLKASQAYIQSNPDAGTKREPGQVNETAMFCTPTYYQQSVNATIELPSNAVLGVQATGEKLPLPKDLFNSSTFEWAMNSGMARFPVRGDFPESGFPDQKSQLIDSRLNLEYIPRMAPFAVAAHQAPMESYLDPDTLRLSYQAAYRLLFARQLSDVLVNQLHADTTGDGNRMYQTQAVVVVPVFAYIATALLSIILVLTFVMVWSAPRRTNHLCADPASIGALMDLTGSGDDTLSIFREVHNDSTKDLNKALRHRVFSLNAKSYRLELVADYGSVQSVTRATASQPVRGVRPTEMKLGIGITFLAIQVASFITFMVLFCRAKDYGLPLPSQSTFVRQLVENYIPIALATLIEPFWLVLNRLLGLLQPFEELRKGSAPATRSIDVDYSSLPPQFLLHRALRARHFVLAVVCLMVLLANVLAVALSGLMYEGSVSIPHLANFTATYEAQFLALNGSGAPFTTNQVADAQGSGTLDQFYREMSNLTAHTELPPWTDEHYAYLPVELPARHDDSGAVVDTMAFGTELACYPLTSIGAQNYSLTFSHSARDAFLTVNLRSGANRIIQCTDFRPWSGDTFLSLQDPADGRNAIELGAMLASNKSIEEDLFCKQHMFMTWLRADLRTTSGGPVQLGGGLVDLDSRNMTFDSREETTLLCRPIIYIGPGKVQVDENSRVQHSYTANTTWHSIKKYFTTSPEDLMAQANQFLVDSGSSWHKDAYPSDFLNYLIKESTNDTTLLDSSQPPPSFDHASQQLKTIYKKLFAILISSNVDLLLDKSTEPKMVTGQRLTTETRILFSTPAFVVTEAIFLAYIITTIFFYARRPWRVLPRLPSTPASIVAFFAASQAMQDQIFAGRSNPRQNKRVMRSGWKWGYGSFKGTDGNSYTGIEKEPLVTTISKQDVEEWSRSRS
ncbi:hypothetical protein CLAFUW4_06852 [Fulvia fulva]|nr:hypothetical protein CLAFUR4_06860 [Fulvia fulva]WPV16760.1 hypothetical protein CLAFUW4_06852 [Fulvia fulva]WPV31313.1 hypothetical protein CLAFUW7_06851 [Fulvia fulva]